jgi:hypothetical protein
MVTENEMLEMLRNGQISLPPLALRLVKVQTRNRTFPGLDAQIEVFWGKKKALFYIEIKAEYYPKAFSDALRQIKSYSQSLMKQVGQNNYLLLVPYLNEEQLNELEQLGISGLDLCGNGIIIVPGELFVWRSGAKNCYPSTALIKKVYQKNSSMVGRVFLAFPQYKAVQDLWSEINQRNKLVELGIEKPMSLSTVSKVLKSLVDDLIIERSGDIKLLQPDKLLEKLSENYKPPVVKEKVQIKVSGTIENVLKSIMKESRFSDVLSVITGLSSVKRYAVMQRGEMISIYTTDLDLLVNNLPSSKTDRFPNIEIIETDDARVYFDCRQDGNIRWASPVQVYLELMAGDKRDQETAEQVESFILNNIRN